MTELINLPFFFGLIIYVNQTRLDLSQSTVLDFYRALDMKQGILYRRVRVKDKSGNITVIEGYRFISGHDRQVAGMYYEVTAENYNGIMTIESITDGTTVNGYSRPQEKVKHYVVRKAEPLPSEGMYLEAATRDQDYRVGIAATVRVERAGNNAVINRRRRTFGEKAMESVDVEIAEGQTITIEKYISVISSRMVDKHQLLNGAEQSLNAFTRIGITAKLEESVRAYTTL